MTKPNISKEGEGGVLRTAKTCPWCDTEIRMIVGTLVKSEYCANYRCFYFGDHQLTKLGKELTDA